MKLVAFCEAASDHRVLAGLLDRVLREQGPTWVADLLDSSPDALRTWVHDAGGRAFFDLHRVRQYALEHGVRPVYGHFDGRPGSAGALMARTVLRIVRCLAEANPEISGVVLMWDMDDEPLDRRTGLAQARAEAQRIDHDREERCWAQTPLETLRERSAETGLREFLDEVKDRLVPRLVKA